MDTRTFEKTKKIKAYPIVRHYGRWYIQTIYDPEERIVCPVPEREGIYVALDSSIDEIDLVAEENLYSQKYEKLSIEEEHDLINEVFKNIWKQEIWGE